MGPLVQIEITPVDGVYEREGLVQGGRQPVSSDRIDVPRRVTDQCDPTLRDPWDAALEGTGAAVT